MPLRLLNISRPDELVFEEFFRDQSFGPPVFRSSDGETVKYAILSHRWRNEEILFRDLDDIETAKQEHGWAKLEGFANVARDEGFEYIWMDTCCIDKSSSTELAEALNSMFEWYKLAEKCFAYLDDVFQQCPPVGVPQNPDPSTIHERCWPRLEQSVWFTRGWTLQELLAPSNLVFYDAEWNVIDRLQHMSGRVSTITGIDRALLEGARTLRSYSVAQRFSWASGRQTTRIEDRAYSLFGIMGVNMPILYGEGLQSFQRLQEELLRTFSDLTLFAWQAPGNETQSDARSGDLLAESPESFRGCGRMIPIPSRHRGQTHRIIGGRVQFEMLTIGGFHGPSFQPVKQAVICCFDDDPTLVVTLTLAPVDRSDNPTFLVGDPATRLRTYDIWFVARASTLRTLDIWRSRADVYELNVGGREGLLLCRVMGGLREQPSVEIVKGEPADEWDSAQKAFRYAEDEESRRCRYLHLRIDGAEIVKLNVEYETRTGLFFVEGLHATFPSLLGSFAKSFWPTALPIPFERRRWRLWGRHFIVASLHHSEQMLHLRAHTLIISTADFQTGVHNFICSTIRWAFGFVIHLLIFGVISLPIFDLVFVASLVPRFQTAVALDRAISSYQNDLLIAVLTIVAAWSIVESALTVSRYPGRYLWPSARYTRSLFDRYFVRWRRGYTLVVNAISLVLCCTYLYFARKHYNLLEHRGVFAAGRYTGLKREYMGMIAVSLPLCRYLSQRHSPSLLLILTQAMVRIPLCMIVLFIPLKIIDWIRIPATLGTAVPLLITGLAGNPYTVPWSNDFCFHQNTTLPFYDFYGKLIGEEPSHVCESFSNEGRSLWLLLFVIPVCYRSCLIELTCRRLLSFWEGFVALFTAYLGRTQWTIQHVLKFVWGNVTSWKRRHFG